MALSIRVPTFPLIGTISISGLMCCICIFRRRLLVPNRVPEGSWSNGSFDFVIKTSLGSERFGTPAIINSLPATTGKSLAECNAQSIFLVKTASEISEENMPLFIESRGAFLF